MADVTADLTRQVAELARLQLSEDEVQQFTAQLQSVLGYVEQLKAIDVTGVEPMTRPHSMELPLREDVVVAFPVDAERGPKIVQSAPESLDHGYKVPPII